MAPTNGSQHYLADPVVTGAQRRQPRVRDVLRRDPYQWGVRDNWQYLRHIFAPPPPPPRPNLDEIPNLQAVPGPAVRRNRLRTAYRRLQRAKTRFYVEGFFYRKCIGYGGMGLALHYRDTVIEQDGAIGRKDIVLKVGLASSTGIDENIRKEIRATMVSGQTLNEKYHPCWWKIQYLT